MSRQPRVSLGEFLGGITLLIVSLGLYLPGARDVVAFFDESPELRPKIWAMTSGLVGIIVFCSQAFYWLCLVPSIRRFRKARRSCSERQGSSRRIG